MVRRILSHPALSVTVAIVWVLLANEISLASVLVGIVIAILVPKFTSMYWPNRPKIRHPLRIAEYVVVVFYDIVVSNIQVAWLVLFRAGATLRSRLNTIPIELRQPEAIAVLAGTITMTPGTVTADVAADGQSLLVHCLEVTDEPETVSRIKTRYEARLKRIFQ